MTKGFFAELAHGVGFTCRDHEVIRSFVLKHHPHRFDIILGKSPVTLGFEVTKNEFFLKAKLNRRDSQSDLARDEVFSPARRLVIEKDAVGNKHVISLAVIDRDPVRINFGDTVR